MGSGGVGVGGGQKLAAGSLCISTNWGLVVRADYTGEE